VAEAEGDNKAIVSEPPSQELELGHKFGLPELPMPVRSHLKHRYDPVVAQLTQLLMKDGKKSFAQRVWFKPVFEYD
jgi:small subunit ribosomal protein S7